MLKKLALSLSLFGLTSIVVALPGDETDIAPNGTECQNVEIPEAECEALIKLYKKTKGANWKNSTRWLEMDNICFWYGITCSNGHVSEIALYNNQLSGAIPASLGNLSELQYLELYGNNLTGSIPKGLNQLTNLKYLDLSENMLTGPIPRGLSQNWINLTFMNLSRNVLTDEISLKIDSLTKLETLVLSYNTLSGDIPNKLKQLGNERRGFSLTGLYLDGNCLNTDVENEKLRAFLDKFSPSWDETQMDCLY